MSALMGLVTLIFDLLTLKLVCESHQWLGNFHSEFGQARPSRSRVICYDMADGQTDEWTNGRTKATPLFPMGGGIIHDCCYLKLGTAYVHVLHLSQKVKGHQMTRQNRLGQQPDGVHCHCSKTQIR